MQVHGLTAKENVVNLLFIQSLDDLPQPFEGIHACFRLLPNRRDAKQGSLGSPTDPGSFAGNMGQTAVLGTMNRRLKERRR